MLINEKDLETNDYRMRIFIYYIAFWYKNESNQLKKDKLN